MKIILNILVCCLLFLMMACEKDDKTSAYPPRLFTGEASDIYRKGATLSGSIHYGEGRMVNEYGIFYSTVSNLAEHEGVQVSLEAMNNEDFSVSITGLEPGTTYYYCTYARTDNTVVKSTIKSFQTKTSNPPIFSEPKITGVNKSGFTTSATLLDEGGTDLILSGFCWKLADATGIEPTVDDHVLNSVLVGAELKASICDLKSEKDYLVRAYGTNKDGLGYGKTVRVKTVSALVPAVSPTTLLTTNGNTTIDVQAKVTYEGTAAITEKGFFWSAENEEPTAANFSQSVQADNETFVASITGLVVGRKYYIRAYAKNEHGMGYGDVISYTPQTEGDVPDLRINCIISDIGQTSATLTGVLLGEDVTVSGCSFGWSTNFSDVEMDGAQLLQADFDSKTRTFTALLTNLTPNTTYYVRPRVSIVAGAETQNILSGIMDFTTLGENEEEVSLVGNWKLTKIVTEAGDTYPADWDLSYFVFNADGSGESVDVDGETHVVESEPIQYVYDAETGNITISGKDGLGEPVQIMCTVKSLTKTGFILHFKDVPPEDDSEIMGNYDMYFIRVDAVPQPIKRSFHIAVGKIRPWPF